MISIGDDPVFDLVVPAHDEERYLDGCIRALLPVVDALPVPTRITIVDSGSNDATWSMACSLAELDGVRAVRVEEAGRGRALRAAWEDSRAPYVGYTDVDLSGDVQALASMLDLVRHGVGDVVIGSRLRAGARVRRRSGREFLSRSYGELLQWMAAPPFLDPQCGLKVMRGDVCRQLLGEVEDEHWFFDTELLLEAWTSGYEVLELPVRWTERVRSTVHVPSTITQDLRGLGRLARVKMRQLLHRSAHRTGPASATVGSVMIHEAMIHEAAGVALLAAVLTGARSRRSPLRVVAVAGAALGSATRAGPMQPRPGATPMIDRFLLVALSAVGLLPSRPVASRVVAARLVLALLRVASVGSWPARQGRASSARGARPAVTGAS